MPEIKKPVEEMPYEEAFEELEEIVALLEGNQTQLEEAITLFERGQSLAKHCADLLEKAELRIRVLGNDTLETQKDI